MTDAPAPRDQSWFAFVTLLLSRGRVIAYWGFGTAFLAAAMSLLSPRKFIATASFIPDGGVEATGGLLAAARQFGIGVGGGAENGWPPGLYVEVLQSRTLLTATLLDTVRVAEGGDSAARVLELIGAVTGSSGQRMEAGLEALRREIVSVSESRMTGSVTIRVMTNWGSVSEQIARGLIAKVNAFNLTARQAQAEQELRFLDERLAEAGDSLRAAEDRLEGFLRRNRAGDAPQLAFERERLQREVTFHAQMNLTLAERREDARLRAIRNTPAITVLEVPARPGIGEPRGTVIRTILGGIIGGLIGIGWVLLGRERVRAWQERPDEMGAFVQAILALVPRRFRPWLGGKLGGTRGG